MNLKFSSLELDGLYMIRSASLLMLQKRRLQLRWLAKSLQVIARQEPTLQAKRPRCQFIPGQMLGLHILTSNVEGTVTLTSQVGPIPFLSFLY